ncbi:hypothetical protein BGZ76_005405, partial [Entomortierella beljakovae]
DEAESLCVNKEIASWLTEPVQTCAPIALSGSQPVGSAPPHAAASTEFAVNASTDKYGRKIIEGPEGSKTIECALKVICFYLKRQAAGDTSARNLTLNPRKDITLVDTVKKYKLDLIHDEPVRFLYMREHLCLIARHQMLLRDEDIRNLILSDTFTVQSDCRGAKATGLVFCFSR